MIRMLSLLLASLSRKVDALALSQSMNPSPNARIEVMCLMCKFISQCTILSIYTSLSRSILRSMPMLFILMGSHPTAHLLPHIIQIGEIIQIFHGDKTNLQ